MIIYPKINLYLHILGKREDGYHQLQTLICFVKTHMMHDEIEISSIMAAPVERDNIKLSAMGRYAQYATREDSSVIKAARLMLEQVGRVDATLHITMRKNIPAGAGLGGGSGDAAATLSILRREMGGSITDEDMVEMARKIGADVAVFLSPTASICTGVGELCHPAYVPPDMYALLVYPGIHLTTAQIYSKLRDYSGMTDVESVDIEQIAAGTHNDLLQPAISHAPVIAELLRILRALPGAIYAQMSGSGSCCFAIFGDEDKCVEAKSHMRDAHPEFDIDYGLLF